MKRLGLVILVALAVAALVTHRLGVWPFGPKYVQILNSKGDPIMGAVLFLQRPGMEEPDFTGVTHTGDGWLEIPREQIHDGATMRATGPACGILTGELPSGTEIRLPPGRPITLEVPGDFALPRPPLFLELELTPAGEPFAWGRALMEAVTPPDYFDLPEMDRVPGHMKLRIDPQTRSVDLLVPCGGAWLVQWSVMRYRGASGLGQGPDEPLKIDIPEGATKVELPLTRAQLLDQLNR